MMIVMFVDDHVWRKTETNIPAVSFILNLLPIATWYSSSGKSNLMQHVVSCFEGFLPKKYTPYDRYCIPFNVYPPFDVYLFVFKYTPYSIYITSHSFPLIYILEVDRFSAFRSHEVSRSLAGSGDPWLWTIYMAGWTDVSWTTKEANQPRPPQKFAGAPKMSWYVYRIYG